MCAVVTTLQASSPTGEQAITTQHEMPGIRKAGDGMTQREFSGIRQGFGGRLGVGQGNASRPRAEGRWGQVTPGLVSRIAELLLRSMANDPSTLNSDVIFAVHLGHRVGF